QDEWQLFSFIRAHEDFLQTFDIELVEGRDFSNKISSDYTKSVLVNEALVHKMGWNNVTAINKKLTFKDDERIIGVFKNYNFYSLHKNMEPLVIDLVDPANVDQHNWATNYVALKIGAQDVSNTIVFLRNKWHDFAPDTPFNYSFLDQKLDNLYKKESSLSQLIVIFTVISLVLACIGVFSLCLKLAKHRTKEIGIRKVIGAKNSSILSMLHKDLIIWVLIAMLLSFPFTYGIMNNWIKNFAYQTTMNWWIFALTGIMVLMITLLTVSWQSWRAASRNPVEALRYE
ncbi:MAG: FtsX-like permease family protein, partial [Bacteroidetes bacterium]|nr:FtsX-like permease family protein [Bacteroidota bacterium]